ncbi:MAG: Crp/Fnr family transcriptional regulator [Ginsengibacter sp.]
MTNFIQFVKQLSAIDNKATDELLSKLKNKTFNKGTYLLKRGEICRYLFFIDTGLAKIFFYKEEKEFIMRFFPENSMFTVLDSFFTQTPSTYSISVLELTKVTYISKTDMDELCKKYHCIETFFRKLVSFASINMMKRISEMLEENGTERYNHFVNENSQLLQRISLGDLANYLGITQVSLSRIRGKK